MNIQTDLKTKSITNHVVFSYGFRIFFLLAAVFGIAQISIWLMVYTGHFSLPILKQIPAFSWHAHEMIYGFSLAIIYGFLLTAVTNWTGRMTIKGVPLLIMALSWLLARLAMLFASGPFLFIAMFFDLLTNVIFIANFSDVLIKTGNKKQFGIVAKMMIFLIANTLFYLGALGIYAKGIHIGIYLGLYTVLSIILVLGRRVIPFFIERSTQFQVKNYAWLDISSMLLLLSYVVLELFGASFLDSKMAVQILAMNAWILAILHSFRLLGWTTKKLFEHPLLWVLWIAYACLILGFALKAMSIHLGINGFLAIHALAVGCIGLMTIGMMSRVSLGHTGRDINTVSPTMIWAFLSIFCATIARVFLPLFLPQFYLFFLFVSGAFWILGFAIFLMVYFQILMKEDVR